MDAHLLRPVLAEGIGTALLLIAVIGSGIMASTLSTGDDGLQLLEAALATGAGLAALIMAFGPTSGAHFNPAVSLADQLLNRTGWSRTGLYMAAQVLGGAIGVAIANVMFELPIISIATNDRGGLGRVVGEAVATYGLVAVIFLMVRASASIASIGVAVGAFIAGAHFFTSSTSFANPAVTIARTLSDSYGGIAPANVGAFILAQVVGALLAVGTVALLAPRHEIE
ncbi:aquaporin [Euzebya tangerina]|uniref:aquaporin n=1 Tax=Euzebya tangerina TaxID=591198 RepID=UPI00196ACF18|nr:aquaporin [Euzebya tangerina]